jgi:hypothetical protein
MAADREKLSAAEDTLARILTDAVLEDLFEGVSEGLWLAVRCNDEAEQKELADRLRARGLEVILRTRAA